MLNYTTGTGEWTNWLIAETDYDERHQGKAEAIFAQGNGYLGQRAALEETCVGQTRGLFVNGTFNRFGDREVTELPNLPAMDGISLTLNGSIFRMADGAAWQRVLNLKTGEITRSAEWTAKDGSRFCLQFRRFVSLAEKHLLAHRVSITPLDGAATLRVFSGINGQVSNTGAQHLHEGVKRVLDGRVLRMTAETTQSGVLICQQSTHRFLLNGKDAQGRLLPVIDRRRIDLRADFTIPAGSEFVIEKLNVVTTSRDLPYAEQATDAERIERDGGEILQKAMALGYEQAFAQSAEVWAAFWAAQQVTVEAADPMDQLMLRFAQYHLLLMDNCDDARMGIGAKGLTGEGYKGHSFWDTEVFILPYFLYTQPEAARKLLEYRYLGLDGARRKAKENGYRGAMYPWEAAWIDDGECTPLWGGVDIVTGETLPILTGMIEQHVTADIAYAVQLYADITGDTAFMDACGDEMLLDTAAFWASRVEWNEALQRGEINDVIGPDEYKEHVNNNAYTNYMAWNNMRLGLQTIDRLQHRGDAHASEMKTRFDFEALRRELTEQMNRLYLPKADAQGIVPQFDGYFDLKHLDLTKYKHADEVGTIYQDYNTEQIGSFQVHKQADTLALLLLLRDEFTPEQQEANYAFYEARTLHDSSLSKSTHCVLAARLGLMDEAYRFYQSCAAIDLGPIMTTSDMGVHTASMGGIWQGAVNGFGGVSMRSGMPVIEPRLPESWTRLTFPLVIDGQKLKVTVTQTEVCVQNHGSKALRMMLCGREIELAAGGKATAALA